MESSSPEVPVAGSASQGPVLPLRPPVAVLKVLPARAGDDFLTTSISNGDCVHTLIKPGRRVGESYRTASRGEVYRVERREDLCFDPATIADSTTLDCPGCTVTVDWFEKTEIRCEYPVPHHTRDNDKVTMIYNFRTPDANPRNKYSQLTTGLLELENRRPFIFRRGPKTEALASLELAVLEEKKRIAAVPGKICGEMYHHFWPKTLELLDIKRGEALKTGLPELP